MGRRLNSKNAAERSAYFARREAARVLRAVLAGDARRRATASIKSLVFSPSVRNKKATLALVCKTLNALPLIKDVLAAIDISSGKWKKQEELIYISAYDILFGQAIAMTGTVEKFLLLHKDALLSALQKLCTREKVKHPKDLLLHNQSPGSSRPRYVRVNTLKIDCEPAIRELERSHMVRKDDMVPDMLVLPSGTDLHDHPLVLNGSIFLQGKASSMVAVALDPKPGWKTHRTTCYRRANYVEGNPRRERKKREEWKEREEREEYIHAVVVLLCATVVVLCGCCCSVVCAVAAYRRR